MADYTAEVLWSRGGQVFTDHRYSRLHQICFDGGVEIPGSASPHVVPLPYSCAAAVDPEEAFIAALASCHMLCFLSIAAQRGYCVEHYQDAAIGEMGSNAQGKTAMTRVELHPFVHFSGERLPDAVQIENMHHAAHQVCFIANSVNTEICVMPSSTMHHQEAG